MATGYTEFPNTEKFINSLPKLLSNDKAALTWNAGAAFPTMGLSTGMPCFRTDQNKLYVYDGKAWQMVVDLKDMPIQQSVKPSLATKTELTSGLATKANSSHSHPTSQITGLDTALSSYALNSQVIKHVAQVLTEDQKLQARKNIDAFRATVDKLAWDRVSNVPTNVSNAVSFVSGQTLNASQAKLVRDKLLTAYQTSATGSLILPNGTIAQRDTAPTAGAIRFNAETKKFEGFDGTRWFAMVTSNDGRNLPTGTCLSGIYKTIPEDFLSLDGSRINKSDYYDLVNLLWQFPSFRGDGSTYAILPNMHHRFFEGTATLSEVATYVEAGLPNITCSINWVGSGRNPVFGGCITANIEQPFYLAQGRSNDWRFLSEFRFNASLSSNVYSKSSTIQPTSLRVISIVRT